MGSRLLSSQAATNLVKCLRETACTVFIAIYFYCSHAFRAPQACTSTICAKQVANSSSKLEYF